jgi:hypothetical protein
MNMIIPCNLQLLKNEYDYTQQSIFKVAALGSNPAKTWSDEISSYVL